MLNRVVDVFGDMKWRLKRGFDEFANDVGDARLYDIVVGISAMAFILVLLFI